LTLSESAKAKTPTLTFSVRVTALRLPVATQRYANLRLSGTANKRQFEKSLIADNEEARVNDTKLSWMRALACWHQSRVGNG
jgi:hypothetical protein